VASNVSFIRSQVQIGFMEGGEGTIFPMSEGLVLSCADALNLEGGLGNDVPFGEGVSGDQDLLDIANSVPPLINQNFNVSGVNDLAILEFDFVASGDSLRFNYSFGSDEYLEWVNSSFNDIFAFFLSGPGIAGPYAAPAEFPDGAINIAEVPNSDPQLPITISSVNTSINDEYYIDNFNNTDIAIDGFTVSLTAEAQLICGETYHIKLAVADGSDTALESIVVLEAGSFESNAAVAIESGTQNPPELGLSDDEVLEGCSAGWFTIFRPDDTVTDTVLIGMSGTAENMVDYLEIPTSVIIPAGQASADIPIIPVYDDLDEGDETATLSYTFLDGCGDTVVVEATMIIKNYTGMSKSVDDIWLCQSDAETVSGLPQDGQGPFAYQWTPGGSGASSTFDIGTPGDVVLTITDFCDSTITTGFNVTIADTLKSYIPEDFYCFGETTGFFPYEGTPPYDFIFEEDSLNITQAFEFTANYTGSFTVTARDQCEEAVSFELIFISCETMIPNVFTPNSDGKNDAFSITGIAGFPGSSLEIYNRWGAMIYSSVNYNNTWDGEDHPGGTYFYIFTRSDGEVFTGHLSLFR
jgi:gliding motility-associated-like protein